MTTTNTRAQEMKDLWYETFDVDNWLEEVGQAAEDLMDDIDNGYRCVAKFRDGSVLIFRVNNNLDQPYGEPTIEFFPNSTS